MTPKPMRGFTLMELLIAVAIVGILAGFALPSYLSQVESSKETEGQALITRILQNQERFYTENMTYTDKLKELGYSKDKNIKSEEGHYKATAKTCKNPAPTSIESCVRIIGNSTTGGKRLIIDSLGNKNW